MENKNTIVPDVSDKDFGKIYEDLKKKLMIGKTPVAEPTDRSRKLLTDRILYQMTKKFGAEQGKFHHVSYTVANIMVSDKTVSKLKFNQNISNESKPFSEYVKDVLKEAVGTGFVLNGKVSPERETINYVYEWSVPHINSRMIREACKLEKAKHKPQNATLRSDNVRKPFTHLQIRSHWNRKSPHSQAAHLSEGIR